MKVAISALDLGNLEVTTDIPQFVDLEPGKCRVFIVRKTLQRVLLVIRMDKVGRVRATYRKIKVT